MKTKLLRRLRRRAKRYVTITMVYLKDKPYYRVGYIYHCHPPLEDDAEFYTHIQDAQWALYKRRQEYVIYLLREIKAKKANQKLKRL